ncbi:hypothetical protein GCM10027406_37040 [Leifsonia lichenia]
MPKRGRGRPKSTSHDDIRDIAFTLFAAKGYAATSLSEIAEAADVSRTTLFAYFPAKRDLVWDEVDERLVLARESLGTNRARSVVDAVVDAMVSVASHAADEHAALARRYRVVRDDAELRAVAALRWEELAELLAEGAAQSAPPADRRLVDHVVRALMAVAARCTDEWSALPTATESLDEYTARHLRPFADALRPLLA